MKLSEVQKGDLVNFDMITPGIFGDQYRGVLVAGVVDYTVASTIDPELNVKHQAFYPYFKDTVDNVNDPARYDYLLIRPDPAKSELLVIGYPWINPSSLEVTKGRSALITITTWEQRFESPLKDFLANLGVPYTIDIRDKS